MLIMNLTRRSFLKTTSFGLGALGMGRPESRALLPQIADVEKGERPFQSQEVEILNPRGRVPLSFIIDDSTCLVNLAHFGIPQFQEVFPDRYSQPWRLLPRQIPSGGWEDETSSGKRVAVAAVPFRVPPSDELLAVPSGRRIEALAACATGPKPACRLPVGRSYRFIMSAFPASIGRNGNI